MKKLLLLLILTSLKTTAQVWIGTVPTYYNPSFAGNTGGQRVSLFFSGTNVMNRSAVESEAKPEFSYDAFISNISTGFALRLNHDRRMNMESFNNSVPGEYVYESTRAEVSIAPKISIKGKYTISPSLAFTYRSSFYEPDLSLLDLLPSAFLLPQFNIMETKTNSLSSGVLFNSKNFYSGITIHLFSNETGEMSKNNYRRTDIPFLSSIQFGYSFQKNEKAVISFTPQLVIGIIGVHELTKEMENELTRSRLDLNFRYKNILLGIGKSLQNGAEFMIGYQRKRIKAMYILEISVADRNEYKTYNRLNLYGGFSLRVLFNKKNTTTSPITQ